MDVDFTDALERFTASAPSKTGIEASENDVPEAFFDSAL